MDDVRPVTYQGHSGRVGKNTRLIAVGLGYQPGAHVSAETLAQLTNHNRLYYLSNDPMTGTWLRMLNPHCESLSRFYVDGGDGVAASKLMVRKVLRALGGGNRVCAAFYGHPAVYLHTAHEMVRRAREEGFEAVMLPAVSAVDCVLADLAIDRFSAGCQVFEATSLLVYRLTFDTRAYLILLQAGVLGETSFRADKGSSDGVRILKDYLLRFYAPEHEVIVYEAPPLVIWKPRITHLELSELSPAALTVASTLVVPPGLEFRSDSVNQNTGQFS